MSRRSILPLVLTCLLAGTAVGQDAAEEATFVLRVGRLHTGTEVLENAAVYVREGRVEAILSGDDLRLPPGVPVVDRRHLEAAPGFVLAEYAVGTGRRAPDTAGARFRALDQHDVYAKRHALLSAGITTVFLHPGSGRLITGEGAVVKLAGASDTRVLKARGELCCDLSPSALRPPPKEKITTPSSSDVPIEPSKRQRPSSRLGLLAELQVRLRAALAYDAARSKKGAKTRPELDLDMQAIAEALLKGRLRIGASRREDLRGLLRLMTGLGLKPVLTGCTEIYGLLPQLKRLKSPVIYQVPDALWSTADLGASPSRVRPRADTPKRLAQARIPFALVPRSSSNLRLAAALAVRGGLSRQAALGAITEQAAAVLGVEKRVGSVRPGRDADFVLLSGDPLRSSTEVVETWVDGRRVYKAKAATALVVRAGTIVTSAGPTIKNGEVLVQDGTIAAVGSSVPHPRGARVIDAGRDAVVTPGFIDAWGHLGLRGSRGSGSTRVPLHRIVARDHAGFRRAARAGITTVVLGPKRIDRSGSRLIGIKTIPNRPVEEDLRRGMVMKEIAGAAFDLSRADPLNLPMSFLSLLTRGKAYSLKWAKWREAVAKWKVSYAKKKAAARAARRKTMRKRKKRDKAKQGDAKKGDAKKGDAKKGAPKKGGPKKAGPKKPAKKKKFDPISGTWEFALSGGPLRGRRIESTMLLKLNDDGKTIQGVAKAPPGLAGDDLGIEGTLDSDGKTVSLTLKSPTPTPMGDPTIKAQIDREDHMTGTIKLGPFNINFEATRTEREVPEIKISTKRRKRKDGRPPEPRTDQTLEPLRAVFEKRGVVVVKVTHPRTALDVLKILKPFKLRVVLMGLSDADLVAAQVLEAGSGVLLRPGQMALRDKRSVSIAAELSSKGLPLAFMSGAGDGAAGLPLAAVGEVARGLSPKAGLAALTSDAAKLLGLDDRVGSLEVGKDGDLLIFDGSPLEATTRLRVVIVRGQVVPEEER